MRGRVAHVSTDAPGDARGEAVLDGPFAGDLAGPWTLVAFDDGLMCWCPDAALRQIPTRNNWTSRP